MKHLAIAVVLVGCRAGFAGGPTWHHNDSDDPVTHVTRSLVVEGGGYGTHGIGGFATMTYTSQVHENDGEPRLWFLGEVRYRRAIVRMNASSRLYGAVGVGAGADLQGGVVAGHLELGVELGERGTSVDVSLRYRPTGLIHTRDYDPVPVHTFTFALALGRMR